MALSDTSKINISIKKLSGKAQTSNDKDLANEGLPTGLTLSSETIFGDSVPTNPSKSSLYTTTNGVVEYLRLSASFIAGTDTSSGRHAFSLQLPDDYESNSSNSKKGTYPFLNKQVIYITSGSLQLVPTSFSTNYEASPYHSASNTQTQIPVLDARDWNLDYFNGIFFQQDPPATGDSSQNPRYVDAFLYIGSSVKDKTASGGSGDANAQYLVLSATGSLPNERVFTDGLGLSGTDGGSGSSYTLSIRDSIVATLTGSQFSGNVGVTGSVGATLGISGSLTRLTNGSSYIVGGTGINISSASNGSITVGFKNPERVKNDRVITSPISAGQDCDMSSNFSTVNYGFNKVDIFVNGQLLASGSSKDYLLNTSKTGSIHFNFDLIKDDTVISIVNN